MFMAFLKSSLKSILSHQPLWRVALIVSAVAILYLATTSDPVPIPSASSDKINHLLAFLQLTLVARLAWPVISALWVALAMMVFGLLIEVIQVPLPYRDFSLLDLAADVAGVALGLVLGHFVFGANLTTQNPDTGP